MKLVNPVEMGISSAGGARCGGRGLSLRTLPCCGGAPPHLFCYNYTPSKTHRRRRLIQSDKTGLPVTNRERWKTCTAARLFTPATEAGGASD